MLARRSIVTAAALLLVVLAPAFAAASGAFEVQTRGPLHVRGEGALHGGTGLLTLAPLGGGSPGLAWAEARGVLVEVQVDGTRRVVEELNLTAGHLEVRHCLAPCGLALEIEQDGHLGARGRLWGAVDFTPGEDPAPPASTEIPTAGEHVSAAVNRHGPHRLTITGSTFAEGTGTVVLWNVSARVTGIGGAWELDTRARAVAEGGGPETERVQRFARLDLSQARLFNTSGVPAHLVLPSPRLDLSGSANLSKSWGEVPSESGATTGVSGRDLGFQGTLAAWFTLLPPGAGFRMEGTHNGTIVVHPGPQSLEPQAAGFTGALRAVAFAGGAAAAAGLLLWAASSPLYFRIDRSRVLANQNRRRIYEVVKENPGLTGKEIAEAADVTPSVTTYHLNKLREYKFVSSRRVGRNRTYYVPESVEDELDVHAVHILRNPTRREVARALLGCDCPPSQKDLVEATGLSQRLVSYHLHKLADVGLVNPQEGPPARYEPTERLENVLSRG